MSTLSDMLRVIGGIVAALVMAIIGHRYYQLKKAEQDLKILKRKEQEDEIVLDNSTLDFNDLIKRESERFANGESKDTGRKGDKS